MKIWPWATTNRSTQSTCKGNTQCRVRAQTARAARLGGSCAGCLATCVRDECQGRGWLAATHPLGRKGGLSLLLGRQALHDVVEAAG